MQIGILTGLADMDLLAGFCRRMGVDNVILGLGSLPEFKKQGYATGRGIAKLKDDMARSGVRLEGITPPNPSREAVLGENRGELARFDYDLWTYEGQAGEVLSLTMKADNPIDPKMECLPCGIPIMDYEEKFPAGILDPILIVTESSVIYHGRMGGAGYQSVTNRMRW